MDESPLKERYMQLQMLDQQIKSAQQQVQMLEQQLADLNGVLIALDDFKLYKKDTPLLVPLTSGIYIKALLQNPEEFTVNIGANVAVKKDVPSTKGLVAHQIHEINQVQEQMMADLQEMISQAKNIQSELQSIMKTNE